MRREHANPLQFLVGEVRLFLVAGAFHVAQSRFLRDTAELRFRYAEQEGTSCLRDIFRDLIIHNLPLCRHHGQGVFFHSQDHRLVNVGVGRLSLYVNLHEHEFGPPPGQRSSVIGVIEVGALTTEAVRSFPCSIASCQMNSIQ